MGVYRRYRIEVARAPDAVPLPPRFRVRVRRLRLVGLVLRELLEFRGRTRVALSRPCVYGVFSRKVGGLWPREELCVGCLRCTVQYPEVVQIHPNPARERLGGPHLSAEQAETILYEARTGRVPVRGAGYRGPFGGPGWDGIWLDMSEIVRPTRDGIHGREHISTAVDLGERPPFLRLDDRGEVVGPAPRVVQVELPFLFDASSLPDRGPVPKVLARAARELGTLVVLRLAAAVRLGLSGPHVVPLLRPGEAGLLERLGAAPAAVAVEGWDAGLVAAVRRRLPEALVCARVPADADVPGLVARGARVVHLVAGPGGRAGGRFVGDLIREAHDALVAGGVREEVTLIAGGGIAMAEHVAKAIACGLDAVALDLPLWVALQATIGEDGRPTSFPRLDEAWAVQRIRNLANSWRDQLLEVLGAMGMREVRRLRGEVGRIMFQRDLEREAFAGVEGFGRAGAAGADAGDLEVLGAAEGSADG
ncbi:MAG TPA: glutamate synthase-related protein [Actinomycetota bacterium]|nr:glutamate synthase-related protein [Actinomycetota bacterium]